MVEDLAAFGAKFESLMEAVIHTPMFSGWINQSVRWTLRARWMSR